VAPEHQLCRPLGEHELEARRSIVANDGAGHAGGNGAARIGVPDIRADQAVRQS
jgi:hypothetical protein